VDDARRQRRRSVCASIHAGGTVRRRRCAADHGGVVDGVPLQVGSVGAGAVLCTEAVPVGATAGWVREACRALDGRLLRVRGGGVWRGSSRAS